MAELGTHVYTICGKQVMKDGAHFCDAVSEDAALEVHAALVLAHDLDTLRHLAEVHLCFDDYTWRVVAQGSGVIYAKMNCPVDEALDSVGLRDTVTDALADILEKELYNGQ